MRNVRKSLGHKRGTCEKFFSAPGRSVPPGRGFEVISEDPKSLHTEFKKLGLQRNRLTYKLLNLLPGIYERGIYKKYGCRTIYEYAGKFAGLSKSVVEKRLRVERHLVGKPCLKAMIAKKGVHKVDLVARIATPETDRVLARRVETMSKSGLFELAKEMRQRDFGKDHVEEVDELGKGKVLDSGIVGFCKAVPQTLKIEFDEEMTFLFLKLKKKIGGNCSNNEVMKMILQKMSDEKVSTKILPRARAGCPPGKKKNLKFRKQTPITSKVKIAKRISRSIPVQIKRETIKLYNGCCAYPNCNKPHEVMHHKHRYAENKSNLSVHKSVIPLCRAHHEFAHSGLIKNETSAAEDWQLRLEGEQSYADFMWTITKG